MATEQIELWKDFGGGKNVICKTPSIKTTATGVWRTDEGYDINNPTVEIVRDSNELHEYRYAKIGMYYYYVKNWRLERNDFHVLSLELDYLMTYKEQIKNIKVLTTTKNYGNRYTPDSRVVMESRKYVYETEYKSVRPPVSTRDMYKMIMVAENPGKEQYISNDFSPGCGIYKMELGGINKLIADLYTDTFVEQLQKKIFNTSMDAIIDYYTLPWFISGGVANYITIGNMPTNHMGYRIQDGDTTITKYSEIMYVPRHYNNFMDYAPYTQIDVFIPGIGYTPVDPSLVMGGSVVIKYQCSVVSGDTEISLLNQQGVTIFSQMVNLARHLPLSIQSSKSIGMTAVGIASSVIPTIVGGAVGGPVGAVIGGSLGGLGTTESTQISASGGGGGNIYINSKPRLRIYIQKATEEDTDYLAFGNNTSLVSTIGDMENAYIKPSEIDVSTLNNPYSDEIESAIMKGVYYKL